MIHGFSTRSSSETLVVIIPLSFVPTFEKALNGKVFASPVLQDDEEQTFFRLISLLETAPVENIALRKGLCYTILGLLSQRLLLADAPIDRHMDFIRQTLQYLEDHYASPLRVESVAACFGYSRSRFSRLFQEHVGCSMPAYLAMLRCRHAAHLLRQSTLKVAQIGLQVGFESLRTFYRTFQNVYGVTPRQFRDQ